jgi:hypothetical protein
MNLKTNVLILAAALASPLLSSAQSAPEVALAAVAKQAGPVAVGGAARVQGKVKAIDKQKRLVVVVGPKGREVLIHAGAEIRNFDQVAVGDMVTFTYAQALAVELVKTKASDVLVREEQPAMARAEAGDKPAAAIAQTVRIHAKVTAVNRKAQTVTLKGAQNTVTLQVSKPELLKGIEVGQYVNAVYKEAAAIEVSTQ